MLKQTGFVYVRELAARLRLALLEFYHLRKDGVSTFLRKLNLQVELISPLVLQLVKDELIMTIT